MHRDVTLIYIGLSTIAAAFFFALGYFIRKYLAKRKVKRAEDGAKKMLEDAKLESEKVRREAELSSKDLLLKMRTEFENETKDRRQELIVLEKRLMQKEENLDRKVDILDRKEKDIDRDRKSINDKEKNITLKTKELDQMIQEEKEKLQNISGMTRDEARHVLL